MFRVLLAAALMFFAGGLISAPALAKGSHSHSSHKSGGDVHVNGYYRKDGTYVAPHMRSAPDGIKNNNWSTKGNVNPYTGKAGTKAPDPNEPPPSSFNVPHTAADVRAERTIPGAVPPSFGPRPSAVPHRMRYSMPADAVRRAGWRGVHRDMPSAELEQKLGAPASTETISSGVQDWRYADGVVRVSNDKAIAWSPRQAAEDSQPN